MHIRHVIDSLSIGGAERMLVELANAARDDGHTVSACVTRSGTSLAGELRPGIPLGVLGRSRRFDWPAMRRFARDARAAGVDVLHAHGRSTFSFLACTRLLGLTRIPIVLHDHYGAIEIDRSVPRWFRLFGARYVAQYVGVYDLLADWARAAGVPADRVHAIGNVLDLSRIERVPALDLRSAFAIEPGRAVAVMVSGLRPEKGLHVLIEAMARADAARRPVALIVGGERDPAYVAACRRELAARGLAADVRLVGERADALALLAGADLVVIPSVSESGPLVLIEALARARPLIATRVGDIAHRADRLGVEELVAPDDPAALARAIDRFGTMSGPERAARGRRGYDLGRAEFDTPRAMPAWYRVYRAALESSE